MLNFKDNKIKIIAIILLVFLGSILFYKITHKTYMKLIVQYDYVPAINKDVHIFRIDVHYRGYDVGDVTEVKLSKDQKHIEFFVNINYKDLKLPTNSPIIFKNENIYGARYLDIEPPQIPSGRLMANGDVIDGTEVYERIDEYLIESFTKGNAKRLTDNLLEISDILKTSLKNEDNEKLLNQSAGDLAIILENLRQITADPSVNKDIKSTIKHSSRTLKSLDEILQKKEMKQTIEETPTTIKKTLNSIQDMNAHIDKVSDALPEINKNLGTTNNLLTDSNNNLCTINTKVPPIPQSLVEKAENLIMKTDCLETELSKVLSKRFLFLKLFFGRPGENMKTCARCKLKRTEKK